MLVPKDLSSPFKHDVNIYNDHSDSEMDYHERSFVI